MKHQAPIVRILRWGSNRCISTPVRVVSLTIRGSRVISISRLLFDVEFYGNRFQCLAHRAVYFGKFGSGLKFIRTEIRYIATDIYANLGYSCTRNKVDLN